MKQDLQDPRIIEGMKNMSATNKNSFISLLERYPESLFIPKSTRIDSNRNRKIDMTWDMDVLEKMNQLDGYWIMPYECYFGTFIDQEMRPWSKIDNEEKIGIIFTMLDGQNKGKCGIPTSQYDDIDYFFPKGTLRKWHYPSNEPILSPWRKKKLSL